MPDVSGRPVIFISYSQKDRVWLDYVRSFFAPLVRQYDLLVWDDEKLQIGSDWRGTIYSALDACHVFIVLVSRYSLASAFVLDEEIPRVQSRPKGEVHLCPIVVTPCFSGKLDWLDENARRPRENRSLFELQDAARDREMADIAEQIDGILQALARTPKRKIAPPTIRENRASAPIAFPSIVDYGRLPEAPYKKLVGRDDQLKRLDDAWNDEQTRIISLVAWGGAGKTSLVIEWLMRVRQDGYRDADAVLCWSFYSQGTSTERAASGEGFLDWALGKLKVKIDTTSSTAKGERLAEELARRRVLLVLDGLEPLQFGDEGQRGTLKDLGLRAFLRGLAIRQPAAGHSLVVLTSRLPVRDLKRWEATTAPLIDLARLSDEAGAALLADQGVKGSPGALRQAARDFEGHALALSLLAGYLRQLHDGNIIRRTRIRGARRDPGGTGHDQARRVVEAFETEWLGREPRLLAIMHMIGLFDRPASADCVAALRSKPVIVGFNEAVIDLDEHAWQDAVARLRAVRLLDPDDPSAPDALDAHPLVREWFGEQLKQADDATWKTAHGRLYDHLINSARKTEQPTLEDLAPLYHAIAHGCRSGRYQEALDNVYRDRICRRYPNEEFEAYSTHKLGAWASDLAALSWFFQGSFDSPINALSPTAQAWAVSTAAGCLTAQGRLAEALSAQRKWLLTEEKASHPRNAAISTANISFVELLTGQVAAAIATARRAVEHADKSPSIAEKVLNRATCASALHASGQREEAEALFVEAEQRQKQEQPGYPLLYSAQGYYYCDLLLATADYAVVRERAAKIQQWAKARKILIDIGLATLALGRAILASALSSPEATARTRDEARAAGLELGAAVEGLRGARRETHIPRGFLARAVFRRSIGDWTGAARDLEEVEEIAEPGPMKLFLCDMALEHARLAFAQIDTFAPLNGLLDDSPPKPVAPSVAETERLKNEATEQLAIAADYIETCGYHRRDEELAELQAVLRGERRFADLPPRV